MDRTVGSISSGDPTRAAPKRAFFISPHLDDAVFSCGRLLASLPDALVATVFAGSPAPGGDLTEWDRIAGFERGDDVVAQRREEDRQALARLTAWPLWLGFTDRQYGAEPAVGEIAAELLPLLRQSEADAVFFPLGLFHSDHRLTREAALVFARRCAGCAWFAYEDALYRRLPSFRDAALADLRGGGWALSPARFDEVAGAATKKRDAVACYASQLRALARPGMPGLADLQAPEAYWQVVPAGVEAFAGKRS